ncbi:hypothetical protein CU669_01670 [Paramagnetospirillum kuznetsovii]|uniref:Uncharacterized protein n=1 Tax=Paramagnetospirillum kuznetsovii TaxID=2053833 RepID=A0A364P3V8_9PROT|nr:hypothetical protein [Paramagnetospirillum kuznetsovii]RAU24013.1 hypothetical protein CU669_01670 [Paramagnetospirillum kuznetsovii]
MQPSWAGVGRDNDERRFDGPIANDDPAARPLGLAQGRARLFQRLAQALRHDLAVVRRGMTWGQAMADRRLTRWQRGLVFYRDHGVWWWKERRN